MVFVKDVKIKIAEANIIGKGPSQSVSEVS